MPLACFKDQNSGALKRLRVCNIQHISNTKLNTHMQCCSVVNDTKKMVRDKERYRKEFSISSERIPEAVTRKPQEKSGFLGNIVTSAFPELSQGEETRGILKIRQRGL